MFRCKFRSHLLLLRSTIKVTVSLNETWISDIFTTLNTFEGCQVLEAAGLPLFEAKDLESFEFENFMLFKLELSNRIVLALRFGPLEMS